MALQERRPQRQARLCPICSISFCKREHLDRHVRSHTKEKPFECTECTKSFGRHDTLLRHCRSHASRTEARGVQISTTLSENNMSMATDQGPSSEQIPVPNVGENDVATTLLNLQQSPLPSDTIPTDMQAPHSLSFAAEVQDGPTRPLSGKEPHNGLHSQGIPNGMAAPIDLLYMERTYHSGSLITNGSDNMDMTQNIDSFDTRFVFHNSDWSVGNDFDIDALNHSIMNPSVDFNTSTAMSYSNQDQTVGQDTILEPRSCDPGMNGIEEIQKQWYTYIDKEGSNLPGRMTPDGMAERTQVDEHYRVNLSQKLQSHLSEDPLPSTEFLNLCIQMYITRFNPIFPVVHVPTFRPSTEKSLLLLSMSSVGSLFIGSSSAAAQGFKIFRRLNKAILATWENYVFGGEVEAMSVVQAALIGQTFGLLSGNAKELFLVETFHGTVLTWARNNGVFEIEPKAARHCKTANDIDLAWKNWALDEQRTRIVLGLYVHDAQLAKIFQRKPLLRHEPSRIPLAAPDDLFQACTATKWADVLKEHDPQYFTRSPSKGSSTGWNSPHNFAVGGVQDMCNFRACTVLESIGASIWEARYMETLDTAATTRFSDSLIAFYKAHCERKPSHEKDTFSFMILWHSIFISLYVDYNLLERAIGREGLEPAQRSLEAVKEWASSTNAERCILHIILMERCLENIRIGAETAIHVPRALFLGAITVHCFSHFTPGVEHRPARSQSHFDFPEVQVLGINPSVYLPDANSSKLGKLSPFLSSILCRLTDHLQRIGHWEISRKFALILEILIRKVIEIQID